MPAYPLFPSRSKTLLSGLWDFVFTPGGRNLDNLNTRMVTFNRRMAVPGCFDACPSWAGQRGTAVYRTHVHVRPRSRSLLRFPGAGLWTRILVDGEVVADCSSPFLPFEVELPARDHELREIVLVIDNRLDSSRVPLIRPDHDFYPHGGVYRSIELHEIPECRIDRAVIRPLDVKAGLIQCEIRLKGKAPSRLELKFGFDDAEAEPFPEAEVLDGKILLMLTVPKPKTWSPDQPDLHKLYLSIGDDAIVERFGLRTVEVVDGRLMLNGEPMPKLCGVNRQESHPEYGPALPVVQLVQDAQLLKDLGCNFVRGAHYPQDQRFLDLCDEMGIMVFEEALNWRPDAEQLADPVYGDAVKEQLTHMVQWSINHPSVIMWGVMSGGDSDAEAARPLLRELINTVRDEDLSRPVCYTTEKVKDDEVLDLADVLSVALFPAWYEAKMDDLRPLQAIEEELEDVLTHLKQEGFHNKPLILGEIGAGAIYGWRDRFATHWSEEYQAEVIERICRFALNEKRLAGVALWQFCDGRTYTGKRALSRPRAFDNKGICDEYRRPKLSYFKVRDAFR